MTRLSLFPLGTVLFPGAVLPLHIFEQRYRRLVREVRDAAEGPREFGVVAIRAGREVGAHGVESLYGIGCTAELEQVHEFADGRFAVVTRGARRFRIARLHPSAGDDRADGADVVFLTEPVSERTPALAAVAGRLFRRYRSAALSAQGLRSGSQAELPADPVQRCHVIASAMILDLVDRQRLLEAPTVDDRLRMVIELLRRETTLVGQLALRPGAELPQAGYSPN